MVLERQHANERGAGLTRLDEQQTEVVLFFVALLRQAPRLAGCRVHGLIHRWLSTGVTAPLDPSEWLRENGVCSQWSNRQKDDARRSCHEWISGGLWCALRQRLEPSSPRQAPCPAVVFGMGPESFDQPMVAVFNSRVPRLRRAGEAWLDKMRLALSHVSSSGLGLASSLGTLTYDLVTAYAKRVGMPLKLWLPAPFEMILHAKEASAVRAPLPPCTRLTCLTGTVRCSHPTRSVCRDRMLAELADVHCLLEIRAGGNLEAVLQAEQSRAWKPRWQARSSTDGASKRKAPLSEDRPLLVDPSGCTAIFRLSESFTVKAGRGKVTLSPSHMRAQRVEDVDWSRLLCHYTRACAGPWPGQPYEEYLLALLDGELLSSHSALDTLSRMILEDRIRASAKLLKGTAAAVSFTSIPPWEMHRLRQWNKALARWTVEPYGFAIDKSLLKQSGIKPVVYGAPEIYERLREQDRFRFQKHVPPDTLWKHEREWRYPGDLVLSAIPSDRRWVFVPTSAEADRLAKEVGQGCTIVALDD